MNERFGLERRCDLVLQKYDSVQNSLDLWRSRDGNWLRGMPEFGQVALDFIRLGRCGSRRSVLWHWKIPQMTLQDAELAE